MLELIPTAEQEESQAEAKSTPPTKHTKHKKKEEQEPDDDFGNRVDYVPQGGLGGVYREPMQGGTQWGFQRNNRRNHRNNQNRRHHRHQQQQQEQEGILSVRQPAWRERIQSNEGNIQQQQAGVLTIRQQGELARSLRWGQKEQQTYISKPNSNNRRTDRRRGKDDQPNGRSSQKNNRNRRNKSNHRGKR